MTDPDQQPKPGTKRTNPLLWGAVAGGVVGDAGVSQSDPQHAEIRQHAASVPGIGCRHVLLLGLGSGEREELAWQPLVRAVPRRERAPSLVMVSRGALAPQVFPRGDVWLSESAAKPCSGKARMRSRSRQGCLRWQTGDCSRWMGLLLPRGRRGFARTDRSHQEVPQGRRRIGRREDRSGGR